MKIRLRLIRARPNIYMISDNPNMSYRIVDCSLYTHHTAAKDDYYKKKMHMFAILLVEFNYLETLTKTFIIAAGQNQFIQENIFKRFQCVGLQTLFSLHRTLKNHSGINNLISDTSEYSEVVNQL